MLDDLERWAAAARAREAADSRLRERWLRQQAEEESTLAGLLVSLAERGEAVAVTTTAGRRHRGPVAAVGEDFVALGGDGGRLVLLRWSAVAEVRPGPGEPASPAGGRGGAPSLGVTLAEVLAEAAAQRPQVSVRLGEVTASGELRAVGADVLTLRTGAGGTAYARLASVSEVSLFGSG